MIEKKSDFIIVGSGLIGLFIAYFLSKLDFTVVLIEKNKLSQSNYALKDVRTTAISEGSKQILSKFGIWTEINKQAEKIKSIKVFDRKYVNKIDFSNPRKNSVLGYIVQNKYIKKTLIKKIKKNKKIDFIHNAKIKDISISDSCVELYLSGRKIKASLLIACDGKKSFIREYFKMQLFQKKYKQKAIVVNLFHCVDHYNTAYEIFLNTGPLACLPMKKIDKKYFSSSIVWSHKADFIKTLDKINEKFLISILNEKLNPILGKIKSIISKNTFPLSAQINSNFSSKRIVYVGDSAHSIHPIAGQGWNLGMRDVDSLINIILKANSLGLDYGSEFVTDNYNKQRYFDAYSLYQVTDKLNYIFGKDDFLSSKIRQLGFSLIDKNKKINNKIVNYAMGIRNVL
ncbi:MAG: 2-octaprenyl-6-methoxyphenol hydroxylase [Alphaproteobacteria bacterium MarineAlpha5_Bin9]|nr:MAG: 2-octaprenyl-6-methoxyphenol hydroxylase [Alphaproteobacteria bacterium MarineAlpha5_Bin9]|tara:strand:- start:7814 stop:9010 length:1197 start_codon:yes stop_codon:yes gene_type:complete